jgi:hypothetical protein
MGRCSGLLCHRQRGAHHRERQCEQPCKINSRFHACPMCLAESVEKEDRTEVPLKRTRLSGMLIKNAHRGLANVRTPAYIAFPAQGIGMLSLYSSFH